MKYLKVLSLAVALVALFSIDARASNFFKDSTESGQWTDLQVKHGGSTTTRTGMKGIIDLGSIAQTDATATTTPVIALAQSATVGPVLAITCTNGGGAGAANTNTCASYTSTGSAKSGSIKLYINGTAKYVDFKDAPN